MTSAQRWVLGELLARYEDLEAALARFKQQIQREVAESPDPFVAEAVQLLDTIPGVGEATADFFHSWRGCRDLELTPQPLVQHFPYGG